MQIFNLKQIHPLKKSNDAFYCPINFNDLLFKFTRPNHSQTYANRINHNCYALRDCPFLFCNTGITFKPFITFASQSTYLSMIMIKVYKKQLLYEVTSQRQKSIILHPLIQIS